MKAKVITLDNKKGSDIELNAAIFGVEVRKDILHRVVNWQLAKRRAGTHKTKGLSEVSGTTKKPFAQKGTGNARQGTLRAPQMRGGGNVHGPVVRSHATGLQKKVRQLGLKVALSAKQADGKLYVLEGTDGAPVKTKDLAKQFKALGIEKVLVIDVNELNEKFAKAARNIKHVDVLPAKGANVYDILRHETLVLTKAAIKQLEERFV
jgi:large subunit ribosomal protein L4